MLYWIDIETTGLEPTRDRILEIGVIVTDDDLEILHVLQEMRISCDHYTLSLMDAKVRQMHESSGLLEDLRYALPMAAVEQAVVRFIEAIPSTGARVLAGSSVHFDRSFLKAQMPKVDALFSHRHADCSALREFAHRWHPDLKAKEAEMMHPARAHRPLLDLMDSINLAKFYKTHIFEEMP